MRPINADSVKRSIEELKQSPWYNEKNLGYFSIRKEAVEVVERLCIDEEPTLDIEPVKHGHWIDIDSESYTWKVRCSECGHERSMMSTQGKYPKYCEECGARMGKEDER